MCAAAKERTAEPSLCNPGSRRLGSRLASYWSLIKSPQTGLLLATGIAGYLSAHTPVEGLRLLGLAFSLFLAISGSTVLNMWYDHDIDSRMERTHGRPSASGGLQRTEVLKLGAILAVLGVGSALAIRLTYGCVVLAGLLFDVLVYTLWLKRRTCWSILWGASPVQCRSFRGASWPSGGSTSSAFS
jgi:heme o synthase